MPSLSALRISSIESEVKAAALIFAYSSARGGDRLSKIRFARRDFVVMEVNSPGKRNYGWKHTDIVSTLGVDIAASIAELHVLKGFAEEPWDRIMLSFPHEKNTSSISDCVLSYHRERG